MITEISVISHGIGLLGMESSILTALAKRGEFNRKIAQTKTTKKAIFFRRRIIFYSTDNSDLQQLLLLHLHEIYDFVLTLSFELCSPLVVSVLLIC